MKLRTRDTNVDGVVLRSSRDGRTHTVHTTGETTADYGSEHFDVTSKVHPLLAHIVARKKNSYGGIGKGAFAGVREEKYTVDYSHSGRDHSSEVEARDHEHAKRIVKKQLKDAGHKYGYVRGAYTQDERTAATEKTKKWREKRDAIIAGNRADRSDEDRKHLDAMQREYDDRNASGNRAGTVRYKGD